MRWSQNAASVLLLGVLLTLPAVLSAQMNWAQVATQTNIGFAPYTMDAADGIVLVGGTGLAISTDKGATWRNISPNISPNPNFVGIAIYDRNIFAVQSGSFGIYITHDQGMSWRPLLYDSPVIPAFPLIFLNDPEKILCTTVGEFVYTADGGRTFTLTTTSLNPYQFKLAADGTVRLFSRTSDDVRTASSSDTGKTWVESTVLPYQDCFSVIADPLNPNVHCLLNEDYYLREHESMIFRTSDNGATWDTVLTHALVYLAGSSDVGCTDHFVGTVSEGILRSTDQGLTWHRVGGPSVPPDYRNLVAADDSLLFALSTNQTVWRTQPVSHTWKIRIRSELDFTRNSIVTCDSVHIGSVIVYPGCSNLGARRANILGPAAGNYEFLDSVDAAFPDTIRVKFTSTGAGTTVATLKVVLEDGANYDFDLSVTTTIPQLTVSPEVIMQDSLIYCELLDDTLMLSSPCAMSVTEVALQGYDSASFRILNPGSKSLPSDSIIYIVCTPQRLGLLDAQLRLTTQYGNIHLVSLRPYISRIPLTVFFDTVWAKDTLLKCRSGRDSMRITAPCAIGDVTILLTDSSNYRIVSKRTLTLPADSIIYVDYTSNGKSDIFSYLTFDSPFLDSVRVPLRRSFKRALVVFVTTPKLMRDTFSFCKEIFDTIKFRSDCPYTCFNFRFEGPDAGRFKIISYPFSLPNDTALIISCSGTKPGQLNADLVFETGDLVTNRYRLMPVLITAPLRLVPTTLFAGDSIGVCSGGFDTVRLSADCPLKIKDITLTGVNASSFRLLSTAPLTLPADSFIVVECLGGTLGRRVAALRIELEDGRVWNIQLSALVVNAPIKIVPAALFIRDSISTCSFGLDTLRLIGPCLLNIRKVTIEGSDASLFTIENTLPSCLPRDSIVIIRTAPNKTGKLNAYLRIEAEDGRVWTVQLSPFGTMSTLQYSRTSFFDRDTILFCSSLSDSITIAVDCPISLTSLSITGSDASSFAIEGSLSRSLPQDSEIVVTCSPSRAGQLDATLHVVSEDGRTWDLPMSIFARQTPFTLSADSLFGLDSSTFCSTLADTLEFSSLCPIDITAITVTGTDAGSFTVSASSLQYPKDSVVIIQCSPLRSGLLVASLEISSSDGRTRNVPMSIIARSVPLEVSAQAMFVEDTLTICDKITDTLYLGAICPLTVSDVSISGTDQTSFRLLGSNSLTLPEDSVIIVECTPQHSGLLNGVVTLTTSDGQKIDVSLTPFAYDRATISFDPLADVSTDTLGGDIVIPITVVSYGGVNNVEFSLHFNEALLEFRGVFEETGVDKTISRVGGLARVAFNAQESSRLNALFSYYPKGTDCTEILLDSITTVGGSTLCLTNLTSSLQANVCADNFCGRDAITDLLRFGKMITLSIKPNPSTGDVFLSADAEMENAYIEIVDGFGSVRRSFSIARIGPTGIKIETGNLASGVYLIRAANGFAAGSARLVLSK